MTIEEYRMKIRYNLHVLSNYSNYIDLLSDKIAICSKQWEEFRIKP